MFARGIGPRNRPASSSGGTSLSLCRHRWNIAVVIPDRAIRAKRHIAVVRHPETDRSGFYEAQEAALTGTGGGMLLEDYIRLRRTQA